MPRAVANDMPDWLEPYLAAVYGRRLEDEMAALNMPAPIDLRVNSLKADRDGARRALAAEQVIAEPTPWSPLGLRLKHRAPLSATAAFKEGLVEVQDEGSQLAALLADARPGMRVVDFCAGAGGKTLALAAQMKNRGKLVACDTAEWRLDRAGERLRRAGDWQCRAPRAGERARPVGEAPCRELRSGAGRCALPRHRQLAAQPGRQMARHPRISPNWRSASATSCERGAAGEAGRPAHLCHLLAAARGKRGAGRGVSRRIARFRALPGSARLGRGASRRAAAVRPAATITCA